MITKENLYKVLDHYGFTKESPTKYTKIFTSSLTGQIIVDYAEEKIKYPEGLDTGDNTTTNFSHPECFVVLECVIRLLLQGYTPDTIYLEKAWTLGHTAKSGRADITVFKKDDSVSEDGETKQYPYLIIECKNAGNDFKTAKKLLYDEADGKQLFSYFCQARSVEWLQLYASDIDNDGNIVMYEEVIKTIDDDNVLEAYKLDDTILTFKNASEAKDAFLVWEDTYSKVSWKNRGLIFGPDAKAYNIGIKPKKRKDLINLKDKEGTKGVVDNFREILRHNSISDKENAFNKLLSLFICKFVDEDSHQDENDVMDFQYVEGTDNYYSLYEKLLNLFNKGMNEYLKEDVFYLGRDYIGKTLQQYSKKKRKNLQEVLEESFQKTKMLSCQVFAFKEVYNEKLFAQNGKILVEMVRLLQDYTFSGTGNKQLLGDLFENLLNQGFKQEAGQFFTPIPITRFIWNSLPIEKYIRRNSYNVPKTIDFACGSGHFLTEGISAVKDAFKALNIVKTDTEISANFYGTEKDNRLARVSKLALLFNGATKANIFAVDGLEHNESDLGRLNSYDILVANPPYSVDEFKKHLSRKVQKSYRTIELMSSQCGDIQNVFSERMQHLLNTKGLASIILPSSYLNTKNEADILTRDLLIKNFYIKAIANFNDKTFGETNTTTIILFLERRDLDVKEAKLSKDSVDAILNLEDLAGWVDEDIFNEYLAAINTDKDNYNNFWTEKPDVLDAGKFEGYFKEYRDYYISKNKKELDKIEITKQLESDNKLKKNQKTSDELIATFNKGFYEYVKRTEEDKILVLSLTYNQQTLILNAPKDNTEQEKFLGYSFSKRRGDEGIKEAEGYLANKTDRNDSDKIAFYIRKFLSGEAFDNDKYSKYISIVKTSDMFNFTNPVFDKVIKTSVDKGIEVVYKWPIVKIGKVCNCYAGGDRPTIFSESKTDSFNIPVYANGVENKGLIGFTNVAKCFNECVTISARGTIGYCEIRTTPFVPIVRLIVAEPTKELKTLFLKEIINSMSFEKTGGAIPQLTVPNFKEFSIPLPPLDVQSLIVSECEAVDAEYEKCKADIQSAKEMIENYYSELSKKADITLKFSNKELFDVSIGRRILNTEVNPSYEIPVFSANVYEEFGRINKLLITDFSKPSVLWGIDGDWMVNSIEKDIKFYPTDHCGVLRIKKDKLIHHKYLAWLLYNVGISEGFKRSYRASIDRIENLSITFAPYPEQERIVSLVEAEEKKINDAKAVMSTAKQRKQDILDKYLK